MRQVLQEWSNFYVIIGSSAAALTGLMFVVVTLVAGRPNRDGAISGTNNFSTPTVAHFCAAFFISGVMSAPWKTIEPAALLVAAMGIVGSFYVLRITHRTRVARADSGYKPDMEDTIWYSLLPFAGYAITALGAAFLPVSSNAMYALATASMLFIFIGIHNAWDIVTFLILIDANPNEQ